MILVEIKTITKFENIYTKGFIAIPPNGSRRTDLKIQVYLQMYY